ncbi:hypothetical protein E4U34_007040, partial [Claviceps purpurea]
GKVRKRCRKNAMYEIDEYSQTLFMKTLPTPCRKLCRKLCRRHAEEPDDLNDLISIEPCRKEDTITSKEIRSLRKHAVRARRELRHNARCHGYSHCYDAIDQLP